MDRYSSMAATNRNIETKKDKQKRSDSLKEHGQAKECSFDNRKDQKTRIRLRPNSIRTSLNNESFRQEKNKVDNQKYISNNNSDNSNNLLCPYQITFVDKGTNGRCKVILDKRKRLDDSSNVTSEGLGYKESLEVKLKLTS
jgi:hypothetical protein